MLLCVNHPLTAVNTLFIVCTSRFALYKISNTNRAYKYARIITMQASRIKFFVRTDNDDEKRPICRVVLDGKDYSVLTLEKGLLYTYPAFYINITYLHAAQQAAKNKCGLFTHPDEVHLLLLPWKFRSGIVNMNSHVLNREHSIAVSVDMLTYACRKVNSRTDSVCCIKDMKARETLLTVKTLTIVGAGMEVFVKPNNRVENGNIICTYSDLPTTSVHGIDPDYHFQVLSGAKSIHYDGFQGKNIVS